MSQEEEGEKNPSTSFEGDLRTSVPWQEGSEESESSEPDEAALTISSSDEDLAPPPSPPARPPPRPSAAVAPPAPTPTYEDWRRKKANLLRVMEDEADGEQFVFIMITLDRTNNTYQTEDKEKAFLAHWFAPITSKHQHITREELASDLYEAPPSNLQNMYRYMTLLSSMHRVYYLRRAEVTLPMNEPMSLVRQFMRLVFGRPTKDWIFWQLVVSPRERDFRRHVAHHHLDLLGLPTVGIVSAAVDDGAEGGGAEEHGEDHDYVEAITTAAAADPSITLDRVRQSLKVLQEVERSLSSGGGGARQSHHRRVRAHQRRHTTTTPTAVERTRPALARDIRFDREQTLMKRASVAKHADEEEKDA